VHRLLNPFGFAAGQLAVFQGASEAPIPHHFYLPAVGSFPARTKWCGTGRASPAAAKAQPPDGKTANRPRPRGLR
jgi:hypothetical protein